MKKILFALLLACSAGAASADALSDKRELFVASCENDGEDRAVCACVFEKWSATVPVAKKATAAQMVSLMASGKQPNMQQMMVMQPLMMTMGQAGVACAGAMTDAGQDMASGGAALPDSVMAGLHADERETINNILAGGITNMDDLKKADAKRQARVEHEAKAEQAAREAQMARDQAARAHLSASYETELAKFEAAGPASVAVGSYENLNTMYCQLQGNSASICQCRWKVVQKHAGGGSYGSSFAYITSRAPGDGAAKLIGKANMDRVFANYPAFVEDEQRCF